MGRYNPLRIIYYRVQWYYLIRRFLVDPVWDRYALGFLSRVRILRRLLKRTSNPVACMLYMTEILRYPPDLEGDVVECGVWKGGITVGLSIACKLANRRLWVCDSFQGLPEPMEADRRHQAIMMSLPSANQAKRSGEEFEGSVRVYRRGEYAGTQREVERNIAQWGEISVCRFVPGWFKDSLPQAFDRDQKFVFSVIDVDLFESMRDCLVHIWPRLQPGARLYTDDGGELDMAAIFFERQWWKDHFGEPPPGMIGAGFGINFFQAQYNSIGLAIKGHRLRSDELGEVLFPGQRAETRPAV